MKKALIALFALAWVFAGCNKIESSSEEQQSENKPRRVVFDIEVVDDDAETKAVKRNWENGDCIYIILPIGDYDYYSSSLYYSSSTGWNLDSKTWDNGYDDDMDYVNNDGIISATWSPEYQSLYNSSTMPSSFYYTMDNLEANDTYTKRETYDSDRDEYVWKITATIHMKQPSNSLKVTVTGCQEGTPVMYVGGDVNNELKYSYDNSLKKVKRTWGSGSRKGVQGKKEADGEYSFFVNPTADNLTLMIGDKCYTRKIDNIAQYAGNAIKTKLEKWTEASYVDENGANQGNGTAILQIVNNEYKTVIWAPVNLGYSNDYPYGKLYQWGRIAGQGYTTEYDSNDEAGTTVYTRAPESYPVATPEANTFYRVSNSDWYANSYANQISTDWNSIEKNDYIGNPCPEGWRLPTRHELNGLFAQNSVKSDGIDGQGASAYPLNNQKVFLPFAGYRSPLNGKGTGRGETFHYWASDAVLTGEIQSYWYVGSTLQYNPSQENKIYSWTTSRNEAASIRCVKE